MKQSNLLLWVLILSSIILTNNTQAQDKQEEITNQEKVITVDSISSKLLNTYVFPDIAKEMSDLIKKNLKKGDYNSIKDPFEFATQLTKDLLSISHDKHIRVEYNPQEIAAQEQVYTAEDSLDYLNQYIEDLKRENFGFKEVKILDGNIGYLDLRSFSDVEYAGATAVSAMNFLSNSNAIIIDLRMNGGGSPAMIQLITSYLFDSGPVHLNNFYWRPTDSHTQTWTLPYVDGNRSPNTPVYVLTSKRTFSAAEEFSYNLKNLERATLIGETTGGGAHPGGPVTATDKFTVWVPSGRAINPITETNWEGVGVIPHIKVDASQALEVAQINALEYLIEESNDSELKKFYQWNLDAIQAILEPVIIEKSTLESYIGNYGPRIISMENNILYHQRSGRNKHELIPLSNDEFQLKDLSSFRIKFISEEGQITALEGHYDNGRSDRNLKNKD